LLRRARRAFQAGTGPGPQRPGPHCRRRPHGAAAAGGQRDPRDARHGLRRAVVALAGLGPADVLVLRALGLGDALTGVAALRGVRRAWPGRRGVLAGPEAIGGWFVRLGLVDAVVPTAGLEQPLAVGGAGGHVAVNLHGRGPQSHRLLAATMPSQLAAFACAEAGHPATVADVAPEFRADEHQVARWCP